MLAALARARPARSRLQRVACYSIWDRVRSTSWHPMATLEQSMLELDRMTAHMLSAPFTFAQAMMPRLHLGDDDFFKDIVPSSMAEGKEKMKEKAEGAVQKAKAAVTEKEREHDKPADQSFSSYSYSSSTIVDEHGHEVTSVRRRYEDSAGRLKAVHERQIDAKKVKSVWVKKDKQDRGKHKTICQSTDVDEFENDWRMTPFGVAEMGLQERKPQGVQDAEKQSESITPGPDYEAAEKAPEKQCGEEASGVTKEAHDRSREDAIAQGSKTQEEETTPPNYS